MGKYDKYKKTTESTNLDKYKKQSGKSFDEIDKKLDAQPETAAAQENKASMGGNVLIVVLGIATAIVWVLAIGKLI
ncbi:hypothetical protein KAR04_00720 [Candidatus Calescamantes bacterium]|nr:hypothetical protein [Candidatus Calescamantes bacterium]MCK5398671.1 hypothetical protein [bacterium]MCK5599936.1 hypothetical protein [bacterium]